MHIYHPPLKHGGFDRVNRGIGLRIMLNCGGKKPKQVGVHVQINSIILKQIIMSQE